MIEEFSSDKSILDLLEKKFPHEIETEVTIPTKKGIKFIPDFVIRRNSDIICFGEVKSSLVDNNEILNISYRIQKLSLIPFSMIIVKDGLSLSIKVIDNSTNEIIKQKDFSETTSLLDLIPQNIMSYDWIFHKLKLDYPIKDKYLSTEYRLLILLLINLKLKSEKKIAIEELLEIIKNKKNFNKFVNEVKELNFDFKTLIKEFTEKYSEIDDPVKKLLDLVFKNQEIYLNYSQNFLNNCSKLFLIPEKTNLDIFFFGGKRELQSEKFYMFFTMRHSPKICTYFINEISIVIFGLLLSLNWTIDEILALKDVNSFYRTTKNLNEFLTKNDYSLHSSNKNKCLALVISSDPFELKNLMKKNIDFLFITQYDLLYSSRYMDLRRKIQQNQKLEVIGYNKFIKPFRDFKSDLAVMKFTSSPKHLNIFESKNFEITDDKEFATRIEFLDYLSFMPRRYSEESQRFYNQISELNNTKNFEMIKIGDLVHSRFRGLEQSRRSSGSNETLEFKTEISLGDNYIPYLKAKNLIGWGKFVIDKRNQKYVPNNVPKRFIPKSGDIIFPRTSKEVRAFIYLEDNPLAALSSSLYIYRLNESILNKNPYFKEYFVAYIRSELFQKYYSIYSEDEWFRINFHIINELFIPIPSQEIQKAIAQLVESSDGLNISDINKIFWDIVGGRIN